MEFLNYSVVNVFTHNGKNGNGLGVFLDTRGMDAALMQAIAKKLGFSETSFVFPPTNKKADYRARFFTPEKELPFAGHPSIGTLFTLRHLNEIRNKKNYVQQIGRRFVEMSVAPGGLINMDQGKPKFGKKLGEKVVMQKAARLLALDVKDIEGAPRVVSTGLPHFIIPLKTFSALKSAKIQKASYKKAVDETGAAAIMPFTIYRGKVRCRMFAPALGVAEDPATGSGCGPLASYLLREGFLKFKRDGVTTVEVMQGVKPGGASLLIARVHARKGLMQRVEVGGYCRFVAARRYGLGELCLYRR